MLHFTTPFAPTTPPRRQGVSSSSYYDNVADYPSEKEYEKLPGQLRRLRPVDQRCWLRRLQHLSSHSGWRRHATRATVFALYRHVETLRGWRQQGTTRVRVQATRLQAPGQRLRERLLKGAGYSQDNANASFVGLNGKHSAGPQLGHPSVRLLLYILIPTALFWIPGILALLVYDARPANQFRDPKVLDVGIFWWSIWLSSIWIGWWACRVGAIMIPRILRWTVGNLHQKMRRYTEFLIVTEKYVAFFLWTILLFALWLAIVIGNFQGADKAAIEAAPLTPGNSTSTSTSSSSSSRTTYINTNDQSSWPSTSDIMLSGYRLWFGVCLSAAILLAEKLFIQGIAYNFHRVSYEDRIQTSKFNVKVLTTLYENSKNLNRKDTYMAAEQEAKRKSTGLHLARARLRKTAPRCATWRFRAPVCLAPSPARSPGRECFRPGTPARWSPRLSTRASRRRRSPEGSGTASARLAVRVDSRRHHPLLPRRHHC